MDPRREEEAGACSQQMAHVGALHSRKAFCKEQLVLGPQRPTEPTVSADPGDHLPESQALSTRTQGSWNAHRTRAHRLHGAGVF